MSSLARPLYTQGYQGQTVGAFAGHLLANGLTSVVDVRANPVSRKPGFSKKALSSFLARHGIRYMHLPALGAPRELRIFLRATGDFGRYAERYAAEVLHVQEQTLRLVTDLVRTESVCLVCFESDPNLCHRSLVADALAKRTPFPIELHHL